MVRGVRTECTVDIPLKTKLPPCNGKSLSLRVGGQNPGAITVTATTDSRNQAQTLESIPGLGCEPSESFKVPRASWSLSVTINHKIYHRFSQTEPWPERCQRQFRLQAEA